MSCNRPYYMIENIGLLLYYIQKYEPNLNFNLVWVDTATENQSQLNIELSRKFHFDRKVFLSSESNNKVMEGITTVYKLAIHLCENNEYFMPLEEDWKLIQTPKIGFLSKTIEILKAGPHSLMGIVYKDTEPRANPENILRLKIRNKTYKIYYGLKRPFQFTNGASIYRMSNINELVREGISEKTWFEIGLSKTSRKLGMFFGFVDFIDNCTKTDGNCYGVFHHVGKISSWHK